MVDLDLAELDAVVAAPLPEDALARIHAEESRGLRLLAAWPELRARLEEHAAMVRMLGVDCHGDTLPMLRDTVQALAASRADNAMQRRLIDQQAAELAEWRRLAADEVRADMQADSDLASALAEARAELERLRTGIAEVRRNWSGVVSYRLENDLAELLPESMRGET